MRVQPTTWKKTGTILVYGYNVFTWRLKQMPQKDAILCLCIISKQTHLKSTIYCFPLVEKNDILSLKIADIVRVAFKKWIITLVCCMRNACAAERNTAGCAVPTVTNELPTSSRALSTFGNAVAQSNMAIINPVNISTKTSHFNYFSTSITMKRGGEENDRRP